MFTPVKLGNTTLPPEVLKADKKSCKRYGPCGVGEQALYLNSFFIDRRYYVALESVRRVFKRVAMSKGGFTGKGAFGSIPYLVVELDDGSQKQCNFKHEEDVDLLLAHMARVCPDIPRHSVEAERRLREKAEREAKRYLKQLTPQAQAARETLEQAQQLLEEYPEQTAKLSTAAKAKRVNDRSNPAYRWVALAIIVAGIAAVVYGIMALIRGENVGVYFALFGLAAHLLLFRRPCAAYRQEQQESHRPGVGALHLGRGGPAAGGLPGAGPIRPPCGAAADDPGAAGGPCPERGGGLERHEKGSEGPERLRAGRAGGVRRGSGHQAHVPAVGL